MARTITLISALTGDDLSEYDAAEVGSPDATVDWVDLPRDAQEWATAQGFGPDDPDELLFYADGTGWDVGGAPTFVTTIA